jgi:hypothetical protein
MVATPAHDRGHFRHSVRVRDDAAIALEAERWFDLQGFNVVLRGTPDGVVADLVADANPSSVVRDYAVAPDSILAVLAAEARWMVEEEGLDCLPGATYVEKARERLRRAASSSPERLRLFPDYGDESPVWSRKGRVELATLGLSEALREALVDWQTEALDPLHPLASQAERAWDSAGRRLAIRLAHETGCTVEVDS